MKILKLSLSVLLLTLIFAGCKLPVKNKNLTQSEEEALEPQKEIVKKEVFCNCVENCWSGEKRLKKVKLEGAFPLETKEEAEFFLHQYKTELVVNELVPCKILQGKQCWRFYFNVPTIKKDGRLYAGCNYWGELDAQTGYINEGIGGGALRTKP